ncbi:MAG: flagellar hook-length control protein FliK [Alphaproteobacteria bacterium]|nr:MAG: flagellar hook-length control protein FliK [Alphaproteobacteria bacterium]
MSGSSGVSASVEGILGSAEDKMSRSAPAFPVAEGGDSKLPDPAGQNVDTETLARGGTAGRHIARTFLELPVGFAPEGASHASSRIFPLTERAEPDEESAMARGALPDPTPAKPEEDGKSVTGAESPASFILAGIDGVTPARSSLPQPVQAADSGADAEQSVAPAAMRRPRGEGADAGPDEWKGDAPKQDSARPASHAHDAGAGHQRPSGPEMETVAGSPFTPDVREPAEKFSFRPEFQTQARGGARADPLARPDLSGSGLKTIGDSTESRESGVGLATMPEADARAPARANDASVDSRMAKTEARTPLQPAGERTHAGTTPSEKQIGALRSVPGKDTVVMAPGHGQATVAGRNNVPEPSSTAAAPNTVTPTVQQAEEVGHREGGAAPHSAVQPPERRPDAALAGEEPIMPGSGKRAQTPGAGALDHSSVSAPQARTGLQTRSPDAVPSDSSAFRPANAAPEIVQPLSGTAAAPVPGQPAPAASHGDTIDSPEPIVAGPATAHFSAKDGDEETDGESPTSPLSLEPSRAGGAAPAGSPEKPAQEKNVIHQVTNALHSELHIKAGSGKVELSLHPRELGHVSMTFTGDSHAININVTGERHDTLQLLRSNIDGLATELRRLGYESVSFSFSGGASHSGQQGGREFATPYSQPSHADGPERFDATARQGESMPGTQAYRGRQTPMDGVDIRL